MGSRSLNRQSALPERALARGYLRVLRKIVARLLWANVAVATIAGCVGQNGAAITSRAPVKLTGQTMGTTYAITIIDPIAVSTSNELHQAIEQTLGRINELMSTYREDSELSQFNRTDRTDWFAVSSETETVVAEALDVSKVTGGAFDPTIGPLVNLWDFGPQRQDVSQIPADDEIRERLQYTGYQWLEAQTERPAIRKQKPDLQIDLSAIAKGYAVDEIAELLADRGMNAYMIEIGGEIRVAGIKADGREWSIGIEAPAEELRRLWAAITITNACT